MLEIKNDMLPVMQTMELLNEKHHYTTGGIISLFHNFQRAFFEIAVPENSTASKYDKFRFYQDLADEIPELKTALLIYNGYNSSYRDLIIETYIKGDYEPIIRLRRFSIVLVKQDFNDNLIGYIDRHVMSNESEEEVTVYSNSQTTNVLGKFKAKDLKGVK